MSAVKYALLVVLCLVITACNAETPKNTNKQAPVVAKTSTAVKPTLEQTKATIITKLGLAGIHVESVSKADMPGLYQVSLGGMRYLYASADAQYFLAGDIYQEQQGQMINLTEKTRATERQDIVKELKAEKMITYTPKGEVKARVMVFTDTDCGYCRKLHHDIPVLNKLGIEISYLAFPRAGVGSSTYQNMVSAWCASDSNQAMSILKRGGSIESNQCSDNPVAKQYKLGQKLGVNGTPALLLENGEMLPGYMPPQRLAQALNIQ